MTYTPYVPHKDPETRRQYQREYAARRQAEKGDELRAKAREYYRNSTAESRSRKLELAKVWREANPERQAEYRRRHNWKRKPSTKAERLARYGLTVEAWESMLAEQNGACGICLSAFPSKRSVFVDHCHTTGAVRGLLCSKCNFGIGKFRDDPDVLLLAVAYLERN